MLETRRPQQFLTTSFRECRDYILDETGTHKFAVGEAANFSEFEHRAHSVGRLSLHSTRMQCRDGFEITKARRAPYYAFQFVLEGNCHLDGPDGHHIAGPGDVFVLGPETLMRERWPDKCLQMILRIDQEWIDQAITVEINRSLKRQVSFEPVARDPGIAAWLLRIADDLTHDGRGALLDNARVARDIERSVTTMLVTGLRHSETEELHHAFGVAPYYVKRAEAYIRENARQDLSIDDIAQASGVSTRTLFYGFKRWRNTSPMAYLRDMRLDLARAELEGARAGAGGKVSDAAINAGFTNFSQFSRVYKARFGETPSETMRPDR